MLRQTVGMDARSMCSVSDISLLLGGLCVCVTLCSSRSHIVLSCLLLQRRLGMSRQSVLVSCAWSM